MIRDLESHRKMQSKSPCLSQSPNSFGFMKLRRSTSPKRYTIPCELSESKKSHLISNSGSITKAAPCESSNLKVPNLSLSTRSELPPPSLKSSDAPIAMRKASPRPSLHSKPPASASSKIKDFSKGKLTKFSSLPKKITQNRSTPKNDENSEFHSKKHQKAWSCRGQQRDLKDFQQVKDMKTTKDYQETREIKETKENSEQRKALAPRNPTKPINQGNQGNQGNRSSSIEKRKLPARYLKIETVHPQRRCDFQSHVSEDLKLLHETSSSSLMKDLEAAKLSRLHRESLKKQSILKNVWEEESWDWSSPEISPARIRKVRFL